METPVFNTVSAIFGKRGSGKTEFLKGNEALQLPGFFKPSLSNDMKVLTIDTIDHPSYRDIPFIAPERLKGWKKGVYRTFVKADEMPELNQLINDLPSMWNTLLVYEDAYKHQYDKLSKPVKDLIIDSKQKNINMVFMYHGFSMAPKDLYRMLDFIELFKTKDHPSVRKDDMPGYYDQALKVYNEVQANPSRFYHKLIDTEL